MKTLLLTSDERARLVALLRRGRTPFARGAAAAIEALPALYAIPRGLVPDLRRYLRAAGDPEATQALAAFARRERRYVRRGPALAGGNGEVQRAYDRRLRRVIARKRPLPNRDTRAFLREARLAARLSHPTFLPVFAISEGACPTYVMAWAPEGTIEAQLGEASPDVPRLLRHLVAIARGVDYLHGRGYAHGDIAARNVALGRFGEAFLLDLGNARRVRRQGPSGALDAADPRRTDIAQLGALIERLLTVGGRRIPADAQTLIRRTRAASPAAKGGILPYASAGELAEALETWLGGGAVEGHRYSRSERAQRFSREHALGISWLSGGALVLTLVVALVASWVLDRRAREALEAGNHLAKADLALRDGHLVLAAREALLAGAGSGNPDARGRWLLAGGLPTVGEVVAVPCRTVTPREGGWMCDSDAGRTWVTATATLVMPANFVPDAPWCPIEGGAAVVYAEADGGWSRVDSTGDRLLVAGDGEPAACASSPTGALAVVSRSARLRVLSAGAPGAAVVEAGTVREGGAASVAWASGLAVPEGGWLIGAPDGVVGWQGGVRWEVSRVACSQIAVLGGDQVACHAADGEGSSTLTVLRVATGEALGNRSVPGSRALASSPDGARVAVLRSTGEVDVLRAANRVLLEELAAPEPEGEGRSTPRPRGLVWTDGEIRAGGARLVSWRPDPDARPPTLDLRVEHLSALAVSPSGTRLAVARHDGNVDILSLPHLEVRGSWPVEATPNSLTWRGEDALLVGTAEDGLLTLDVATGVRASTGVAWSVYDARILPQGILLAGQDVAWLADGAPPRRPFVPGASCGLDARVDVPDAVFACFDGTVRAWNRQTSADRTLASGLSLTGAVRLDPSGSGYVLATQTSLELRSLQGGAPLWSVPLDGLPRTMVTSDGGTIAIGYADGTVEVRTADGTLHARMLAHSGDVWALAFAGETLFTAGNDGRIRALDVGADSLPLPPPKRY